VVVAGMLSSPTGVLIPVLTKTVAFENDCVVEVVEGKGAGVDMAVAVIEYGPTELEGLKLGQSLAGARLIWI
jgi:hypothetical protein